MTALKLIAAVLLFAVLRALVPWFSYDSPDWRDGFVGIGLAVAAVWLVFYAPKLLSKNRTGSS